MHGSRLFIAGLVALSLFFVGCGVDEAQLRIDIVKADNPRALALAIDAAVAEGEDGVGILTPLLDVEEVRSLYLDNVPNADDLDETELLDEINRVRIAAVRGLADIGLYQASQPLNSSAYTEDGEPLVVEALSAEQNASYRSEVILALGELDALEGESRREMITLIQHGVEDPAPEVRRASAESIAALNLHEMAASLNELAADESPAVKLATIQAISKVAGYYLSKFQEELAYAVGEGEGVEAETDTAGLLIPNIGYADSVLNGDGEDEVTYGDLYLEFAEQTVKTMIAAMNDQEPSVRISTAVGMLEFPFIQSLEPLVETLDDPNHQVRVAVVETLTTYEHPLLVEETTELCSEVLSDRDPTNAQHRMMVALLLGRQRRGADDLVFALSFEDEFWFVKLQLINALGNIDNPEHLSVVSAYLDDEDADVARAAVLAVGQLGDSQDIEGLFGLIEQRPELTNSVIDAVTNLSEPQDVVAYLDTGVHSEQLVQAAIEILSLHADPETAPPAELLALLESVELNLVESALDAVSGYNLEAAEADLLTLLNRGFDIYSDYDPDASVEELQAVLGRVYSLRISTSSMLVSVDNRTGIEMFIEGLEEGEANTPAERLLAVAALGRIGSDLGVMPVVDILNETDPNLRWAAADILASFADERTISFLTRNLGEGETWTNVALIEALLAIGDKNTLTEVAGLLRGEYEPEVKLTALHFVAQMRDRTYNDTVAALLEDENLTVQFSAAQLLAGFGEERGFEFFAEYIEDDNPAVLTAATPAESPFEFGLRLRAHEIKELDLEIEPLTQPEVRMPAWAMAVKFMTELGNNKLYAQLAEQLEDDTAMQEAFFGIYNGEIAALTPAYTDTAYVAFEPFLESKNDTLRSIGVHVLKWIGSENAHTRLVDHLSAWPEDAPMIINVLAELGANTRLRELFRTADEPIRVLIADYFSQREDKRMTLIWGQIATEDLETEPSLAVRWEVLPALAADTTGVGRAYLQLLADNTDEQYPPELQAAATAALAGEPLPPVPVTVEEPLELAEGEVAPEEGATEETEETEEETVEETA